MKRKNFAVFLAVKMNFANDHRLLVEPACGASLAIMYNNKINLPRWASIMVIVCGGSGISFDQLNYFINNYKEKFL